MNIDDSGSPRAISNLKCIFDNSKSKTNIIIRIIMIDKYKFLNYSYLYIINIYF